MEKIYISGIENWDENNAEIESSSMILVDRLEDADYVFLQKQVSGLLAEEQFRTLVRSKELGLNVGTFKNKDELNGMIKERTAKYITRERMDMEME